MELPESLDLHVEGHLSTADAERQRKSAQAVLDRFVSQPGVILGDEVGMGKTFVALAVAAAHVVQKPSKAVVIMVPMGVLKKWSRDGETFRKACLHSEEDRRRFRVGIAETGSDFLKLLDVGAAGRANVIVLAHGALNRKLADRWIKLAVLQAAVKGKVGAANLRERIARFAHLILWSGGQGGQKKDLILTLLNSDPQDWKEILVANEALQAADDEPVPRVILDALQAIDLSEVFSKVVELLPERHSAHFKVRIRRAQKALNDAQDGVLPKIWRQILGHMHLSLPLLILDEAHRVRNGGTQLASLLSGAQEDLDAVKGQLSGHFDRMLFLTATPFQLGHSELHNVLVRFNAINWSSVRAPSMNRASFNSTIDALHETLDKMQLATDRLEHAWKRLLPLDIAEAEHAWGASWWDDGLGLACAIGTGSNARVNAVRASFGKARSAVKAAEALLQPWVLRNARSMHLPVPYQLVARRLRIEGGAVIEELSGTAPVKGGGIKVSPENALPFLIAARMSTLEGGRRIFTDSIASSFEAMLDTHREDVQEDGCAVVGGVPPDRGSWYEARLRAYSLDMGSKDGTSHPKVKATVDLAMSLWRKGEKVLIFCHYRQTGAALHRFLSEAMLREIDLRACEQLRCSSEEAVAQMRKTADLFDRDKGGAREVSAILDELWADYEALGNPLVRESIFDTLLRFLRTPTFLVRFENLSASDRVEGWVGELFERQDASGMTLEVVVRQFLAFLGNRSSDDDRFAYLDALKRIQTGTHAGPEAAGSFDDDEADEGVRTRLVANVRRVYGKTRDETRERIALAFNTPFYPEILIASSVMAEGVDLHLNCRHVIHHDLDWNPSSLEQRTGRIDRLGAKAERSGQSIRVYLPYVEGCQDEKLFRVVMDRERWFGVVMGAEKGISRVLQPSAWEIEQINNAVPVPIPLVQALKLSLGA